MLNVNDQRTFSEIKSVSIYLVTKKKISRKPVQIFIVVFQ